MKMPITGSFYFALFLLMLMVLLITVATQYNSKAALMPLVVAIPTAILIVVEMVREQSLRFAAFLKIDGSQSQKILPEADKASAGAAQKMRKELTAILIVIGFMVLVLAAGFLVAIPVFSFLFMFIFARESWVKAVLASFCTWLFIYLVFCSLMEIRFPSSFLF